MTQRMTKSGGLYVPNELAAERGMDASPIIDFINEMKEVIQEFDKRLQALEENAMFMKAAFDQVNWRLRQAEKKLMTKRNRAILNG